jgi:hypothetical protein
MGELDRAGVHQPAGEYVSLVERLLMVEDARRACEFNEAVRAKGATASGVEMQFFESEGCAS